MIDFEQVPRIEISHGPTPIEFAPRLSQELGCDLYFKRDDCTGLASGGNKTRKLEYLIADAKTAGADTLITIGGLQSNHARQTAAAAAKFGFRCDLILEPVSGTPKTNYTDNGNLLLDHLLGATIHRLQPQDNPSIYAEELIAKRTREGCKPYLIPVGGSNVIGSFGYVRCGIELAGQLLEQNIQLDQIVLATGSAGTQAGLLAGFIAAGCKIPVLGISVSRSTDVQRSLVENLLQDVLSALELNPPLAVNKVITNGNYVGDGYGIATAEMIEAVKSCARLEGLLLDPVYTGKAMAGLIDLCKTGSINSGSRQLFLHTGGSPGLYGYQEIF
jgi:L-cysteate sulfo-lyase